MDPKVKKTKFVIIKISIYSLKRSSRVWYFRLYEAIISFGLSMVSEYHCVYIKKTTEGIIFLTLYVDDILLARNNMEMIPTTKKWLSFVFKIKDMGEARYVLYVEISRNHSKKLLALSKKSI